MADHGEELKKDSRWPVGQDVDLSDPKCIGVLLPLLWKADEDPAHGWHLHLWPDREEPFVCHASETRPEFTGRTAGDALAKALLHAWAVPR